MKKLASVNDFVIRFANVNGSGSASANNLFAKAVFRMGIPVSPKNIFPSNIQGLPTWYEVRISKDGYLGRRGGYDFIVAINGQTLKKDYEELLPGGYFLYDSTRSLDQSFSREDITLVGIPLTRICNEEIENIKLRPLLKNIIYVGALSALLDMEFSVLTDSLTQQFAKKPKLAEPNIKCLEIGFDYAEAHFKDICDLKVSRRKILDRHILMDGNTATALGAMYGGATVAGWYPITPSTSVVEAFDKFTRKYRLDEEGKRRAAVIQAEDELAAMGIAMGAGWNGVRAFTATSGPGVSLMNELLGLAYFAEIPVVLVDVQRTGPSTGMPTRTQQSDILACAYASHGDTKHLLLIPSTPGECFDLAAESFDLAEALQTPVIFISDLDLGMNDHVTLPMEWDDSRTYNRGKVLDHDQLETLDWKWGRYLDRDKDGIGYRTYPGTHPEKGAYFTRGSSHDEYAKYTEDSEDYKRCMARLDRKWQTARSMVPGPEIRMADEKARAGVIFYGTSAHAVYEAVDLLKKEGIHLNTMRLKAFPFPEKVLEFIKNQDQVFIVEQNRDSQMRTLLVNEFELPPATLTAVPYVGGTPIDALFVCRSIQNALTNGPLARSEKGGDA